MGKTKMLSGDPESPVVQVMTFKLRFHDREDLATSVKAEEVYEALEVLRKRGVLEDYHMYDFE
jgi:hypothetical protein